MIGQRFQCFFCCWHPQLYMPVILVSLEFTSSWQPNGKCLVFMHCTVLELQLFFLQRNAVLRLSEMYACMKQEQSEPINMGLIPLGWCGPLNSNDISIIGVMGSWGVRSGKYTSVLDQWRNYPLNISATPTPKLPNKAANLRHAAAGSCSSPVWREVASENT